jgi:hypothetical protein
VLAGVESPTDQTARSLDSICLQQRPLPNLLGVLDPAAQLLCVELHHLTVRAPFFAIAVRRVAPFRISQPPSGVLATVIGSELSAWSGLCMAPAGRGKGRDVHRDRGWPCVAQIVREGLVRGPGEGTMPSRTEWWRDGTASCLGGRGGAAPDGPGRWTSRPRRGAARHGARGDTTCRCHVLHATALPAPGDQCIGAIAIVVVIGKKTIAVAVAVVICAVSGASPRRRVHRPGRVLVRKKSR